MNNNVSKAALDELKKGTEALGKPWVSELVIQTSNYETMRDWYSATLGVEPFFENLPDPDLVIENEAQNVGKQLHAARVRMCFIRLYITETIYMVVGIFEKGGLTGSPADVPGMNHMQFKDPDVHKLVKRIELLRDAGMTPHRCANHGPMTSFYFMDPDQNVVEFCCDNFDTPEKVKEFMKTEKFAKNPSGIDIDRDEFIERYHSGVPTEELLTF